jgi:CysZ protein
VSRGPGLLAGPAALGAALRLLRARRELWLWCLLPFAINIAIFALALAAFFAWLYDPLVAGIAGWLSVGDPSAWWEWLWVGPLRALAWLAGALLVAAVAFVVYFGFTLIGGVVAAPFLDVLSRRVERVRTGRIEDLGPPGLLGALRGTGRAVVEEAKRVALFLAVQAGFLVLALVPGLQPVAAAGAVAFAVLFLPLDYTGYALDRRAVRFRERRRWIWRHRGAMSGFGAAALATFLVPGLNFLCLPWLVTAGTLLAIEVGPPDRPGPGLESGSGS